MAWFLLIYGQYGFKYGLETDVSGDTMNEKF